MNSSQLLFVMNTLGPILVTPQCIRNSSTQVKGYPAVEMGADSGLLVFSLLLYF